MTTITPKGRLLAIAAGTAFTYGGLRIILGDRLTDLSQWDTGVQLTVLMVGGTIAAGHLMRDAWRGKQRSASAGFLVLLLAGTGLVVFNSVGRQAETSMMTEADMMDLAERKTALKADLKLNEDMLKTARLKLGKECETGDGTACKGKRATVKVYEDAVAGVEAKLATLGPVKPVHAKATEGAKIAAIFGADEAKAKAAFVLLEPFLWCLFFEWGSIVSLGFAFRTRAITETASPEEIDRDAKQLKKLLAAAQLTPPVAVNSGNSAGNWGNPGNGGGPRVYSKRAAERDLVTRLALGETVESQDDLAARYGVDKSTVSKWLKDWRARDLVPVSQRIGRCHRLVAA